MNKNKILKDLEDVAPADMDEMDRLIYNEGVRRKASGKNSVSISRK
jgi:hypothetical protein